MCFVALFICHVIVSPPLSPAQEGTKLYTIQVSSTKDAPKADSLVNELKQKGYTPVYSFPKGEWIAVCIGIFRNYADAAYSKEKLRAGAFPDAFILSREISEVPDVPPLLLQNLKSEEVFQGAIRNDSALTMKGRKFAEIIQEPRIAPPSPLVQDSIMNSDNASLSEEDLLKKAGGLSGQTRYEEAIQAYQSFLARFPSSLRIPDVRMGIAYAKLKQDKTAESKILFQGIIQSYPASREAGEAALRLGYLKIREKDDAGAKILFQNIAAGTIKADSAVKAEAQARLDNFERREKIQTDPAFALLHQGYAKIAASDEVGASLIFDQLISANPKSEAAGEGSLRLAYMQLNKAGKSTNPQEAENLRAEALARFEEVARGEIAASPPNRLEAMLRCAKTYHSRKERIRALQAYREIAALSDADGIPDPDIHTEMAGLYMELARSGKGSLNDCIRECDIVLSSEGATRKNKATALQMKAESFHFLNDFKTSIDLEKSLLETYPEQKPMAMLAHFYLGLSYYQLEDPWNSLKSMEKVEKDFSDSDNLPGNDLRLSARLYQAQALLKMEKRPEAKAILEKIIFAKPESKEAHDARKLLDVIK